MQTGSFQTFVQQQKGKGKKKEKNNNKKRALFAKEKLTIFEGGKFTFELVSGSHKQKWISRIEKKVLHLTSKLKKKKK